MRSAILHVGPHKTGTTYLQKCFSHHRDTLRARGVILPAGWDHGPGNHSQTGLVRAVTDGGDLAQAGSVIDAAFADASGARSLLVSAEDLSVLKTDALRRLRTLLGEADVTIVFYVRRWSDILPSAWQEQVKQGHSASLPEFLYSHLRNPEASQILNFDLRLANLTEVFGQNSVRLVCYSALRDGGHDIFTHFAARFLRWPDATPPPGRLEPNTSRDVASTELLRRLNSINLEQTGQRSLTLRGRLDAASPRIDVAPILAAMQGSQQVQMFSDGFPALQRLHEALWARYEANVSRPGPPKLFFRPQRRDLPYLADDYLLRPGVVEALHALYRQLAEPS